MMLRDAGETTPLIVVFAGICLGILALAKDLPNAAFCLVLIAFLLSRRTVIPLLLGIIAGCASMYAAPQSLDIREGDYSLEGKVGEAGFMQGSYRITLDEVSINGHGMPGRLMLRVYGNVHEPGRGCTLQGMAHLKPWPGLGNAGEFDYRTYMLSQGVTASGYIKDLDGVSVSGQGRHDRLKRRVVSALAQDARPEAEILNAALTGDRSGLVFSLQDSFSALGVTHLIAISGLNMGVMFLLGYSLAFLMLRCVPPAAGRLDTPCAASVSGLACVLLYTLFVGYSPPTARAAIMAGTAVVSLLILRRPSLMESLALSGIIILLWMPWSLYSASFLLSFGAVAGIIGIMGKLKGRSRWLLIPAVPIVSTAFTAPLVVYLFGFMSPVGIIANILFVPWFSFVIMPLGIAGLAALPVSEGAASWLLSLAYDGTGLMLRASECFGSLAPVPCPGIAWVMICYTGILASFFGKPSPLRKAVLLACVLFIVALPIWRQAARAHEGLMFDFINVGQADCTLITKGTKAILIDAGSSFPGSDAGRFIVGPHLLRRGITKLDLVILTHDHPDHIGGMPFILKRFGAGRVWTNAGDDPSPDMKSALRAAMEKAVPVQWVHNGDSCRVGDIQVQVLSPPGGSGARAGGLDHNLNSIVVRAGDAALRGLFMADAWGLGEIRISRLHRDISADVLKVAHHGSKGSCLTMFLNRVRPSLAVIPVGKRNLYRLPHEKALQRLSGNHIPVFRTDLCGEITISRDERHLCVKSGLFPTDTIFYSATPGKY